MAQLRTINNNYYSSLEGKVFKTPPPPALVFEINSDRFLPASVNPWLKFTTSSPNVMHIDYGDGAPIASIAFSGTYSFAQGAYIYSTTGRYKVKIWFDYPIHLTTINLFRCRFIGTFPLVLGLYNLDNLVVRETNFESFPVEFTGGIYKLLQLDNVSSEAFKIIPEWILSSKINTLSLQGGFEFNATNNLDRLIELEGLQTLSLTNNKMTVDQLPSNLSNLSTLRRLVLGENPITEINSTINNYRQLTDLEFGYEPTFSGNGNSKFINWGVGIANMHNLKALRMRRCTAIPPTLPTGLETATQCKTLLLDSCYLTTERVDTVISDAYARVTAAASVVSGNTLLRNINLNIGWVNRAVSGSPPSPGIYQAPSGYVQGSYNGNPVNSLEKIYVLVKQYGWTITVVNQELTANITY